MEFINSLEDPVLARYLEARRFPVFDLQCCTL